MWRTGAALILALSLVTVAAACSSRDPADTAGPALVATPPPPTATPTPLPPLEVDISLPNEGHQGFAVEVRAEVRRRGNPAEAFLEIDFGDGGGAIRSLDGTGTVSVVHIYRRAGAFTVRVTATESSSRPGEASAAITIHPRRLLFIQGMNSTSHCPDGRGFSSRAPDWLGGYLYEPENVGGLKLGPTAVAYFSYSGRWCADDGPSGGAYADYADSDTCGGIDEEHAPRLKAAIEALAPSRVTIIAHSMGGLVAAYLVAIEPQWAEEHIASIATFDSPLGGINGFRSGILGAGGVFDGDCGPFTEAVQDLREDSSVVKTVRSAPVPVPFYTSDATDAERMTLGRMQAVPPDKTHLDGEKAHARFSDNHSKTWSSGGEDLALKQRFVACAVALQGSYCLEN